MRVTCPSCQTAYNIDERRIPPGGAKLKCSTCQGLIPLRAPEATAPPPPPPQSVAGVRLGEGAVPLPGLGLPQPPPPQAPALPQLTPRAPEPPGGFESLTTGAIALPPTRAPTPIGSPSAAAPPPVPRRSPDRTMVAPMSAAPVELPAPAPRAPPPAALRAAPPVIPVAPPPDAPLPSFEEAGFDDDALTHQAGDSEGAIDPGFEPDIGGADASGWPDSLDDGSYGALPVEPEPAPPAPVAPPPPATAAAGSDAAAPWDAGRAPEFGTVDFGGDDANATDLPIPADDPLPEGEPAWTEADAPAAGALDLSDLPQTRALRELDGPPPGDPLEFDPTKAAQEEDLEADLSKPLPASVPPPEDGLEVLGFLDEAAKEIRPRGGRVTRYHVRRRSGKVFGPFEPGVIVKMLEDGQLLGSEEVSQDGEGWSGMASVPTFAQAMQRLLAAPAAATAPVVSAAKQPAAAPERPRLGLDQLAQAYGGRMAVVSVVDGEAQARNRKRYLVLGASVLAGLLVIGAGASLGATRYGAFGLRWLLPASISATSPEGATFAEARAALADDTWPGLAKARLGLEGLLARREYPEVRAVWCQSVFGEQLRWGSADPSLLAKATAALEDLKVLPRGNPERIKAEAGQALVGRQSDVALGLLRSAKLDGGGTLLEAEGLQQKGSLAEAAQLLDGAMKSAPSGAGWHALGLLQLKLKKSDRAEAAFTTALKVAPQHLSSAVELAALALDRKDGSGSLKLLEAALAEPKALAPAERARGLAVRGAALLLLGRPADALPALEEALKLDPKSTFVQGTMARTYSALKQDEKALPLWKTVVGADPGNPLWVVGEMQSLATLHKDDEALKAAARARTVFSKDPSVALVAGRTQEQLDRISEAEASYRAATQLDPSDPDAALQLARLYLRERRPVEARSTLAVVTEKRPQDARLRIGLGDLAMATGELGTAQSEYERATSLSPDLPEAWVARARLALEKKGWKDANTYAEKALLLSPSLPEGHLVHGLALWHLGDLDPAAKELEAGRSGGPNSKLEVSLAAVHFEKGEPEEASTLLSEVLRTEPGNPDANFWMARVHDKKGEYATALESIRAAIDRAPSRAAYHHELGVILKDAGKLPEAVEAWKQAVKLDPGYADAWEKIGQAYLDTSRFKEAIPAFEAALRADPGRARCLGSIGDAHFQAGKWAQAISTYQAALKADPHLKGIDYRLGRAHSELGQYDKAIGYYQKAVADAPDDAQAWYHLGYALKERGKKRDAVNAFQNYLAKAPEAKDRKDIEDEIYFLSK